MGFNWLFLSIISITFDLGSIISILGFFEFFSSSLEFDLDLFFKFVDGVSA
jgi:hypothetical protein